MRPQQNILAYVFFGASCGAVPGLEKMEQTPLIAYSKTPSRYSMLDVDVVTASCDVLAYMRYNDVS